VLVTCVEALQDTAAGRILDLGGVPIRRPLIRLSLTPEAKAAIAIVGRFDWVALTSPTAVQCFLAELVQAAVDLRRVPRLLAGGAGTARELRRRGLIPDVEPAADGGTAGLVDAARSQLTSRTRVLRLRSAHAGTVLADALRTLGATVDDCILYTNEPIAYDHRPEFDAAIFASASAVDAFVALWGRDALRPKTVVAVGTPAVRALSRNERPADIVGPEATVEAGVAALAAARASR